MSTASKLNKKQANCPFCDAPTQPHPDMPGCQMCANPACGCYREAVVFNGVAMKVEYPSPEQAQYGSFREALGAASHFLAKLLAETPAADKAA